jgi:hypothetical protein
LALFNLAKLTGVLYLENNLTPHVFTPDRTVVLKVLRRKRLSPWRIRDCIAISKIRRLVDANILAITRARCSVRQNDGWRRLHRGLPSSGENELPGFERAGL